jgi:hypothetical protein
MEKNIAWFKENIVPLLEGYEIEYSFFEKGDFGDLDRVEIEGNGKGVTVEFWGMGWLGLHIFDYIQDQELLNILLEPNQYSEKERAFKEMLALLKK